MLTRGDLKLIIKKNLENLNSVFYSDIELNDSLQDAYDDIGVLTQCILKSTTINFAATNYYNFKDDYGVTDYLATVAIFNNNIKLYLRDDLAFRQFDRLRRDWENWRGNSQFWAPVNFKRIAMAPFNATPTGTFKLYYWAIAPTFVDDTSTNLIATDMQNLFTHYSTGDLLESAEEFSKAQMFIKEYFESIQEYKDRSHNYARSDLMLRV